MALKQVAKVAKAGIHAFDTNRETLSQNEGQVREVTEATQSKQHLSEIINKEQKFPERDRIEEEGSELTAQAKTRSKKQLGICQL